MFSALYGRVVALRNAMYDRGVFKTHGLGARTISIGNITTGGTGKTPLVAHVAEVLADRGEKVCILTRGYGRKNPKSRVLVSDGEQVLVDAETGGDEPAELANKLLGKAVVVADPNRTAAGVWAKEQFGITAFILDDGFQHRRLQRDLNVVCIDTADPFGEGKLLPAGRLREPVENLSRANAVILMRADSGTSTLALRDDVRRLAPSSRIFEATRKLRAIRPLSADDRLVDDRKFFVFAGLGGSTAFATWIARQGIEQAGIKQFRDHHRYTQPDVRALEQDARSSGANALLTTAKDAVKLAGLRFDLPCFVVEIQVELDDPSGFASLL